MNFEAFHHTKLGALLTSQAASYPDRPYLRLGDKGWTYAEAESQATRLAAGLIDLGLQPGDRLAVILPNIPAFVLILFAAAKAGLILVPINVRRSQVEVSTRLAKTRPKTLITFSDPEKYGGVDHLAMGLALRDQLPDLKNIVALQADRDATISWQDLLASAASFRDDPVKPEDPAAIVYSLGSSGQPRGAVLSHGGLVRNAAGIAATLACTPDDIFLGAPHFSNTFGLTATILACTVAGAQLSCLPKYHPAQALAQIAQDQVTVHNGVPTLFAMELNHPDFSLRACESLRIGIMAGASCPPGLVARVRQEMDCNVIVAYGLTEASPSVTMTRLEDGPITATETVGRPMEGVEIKVVDASGESLPTGKKGELCVRGYNVMLGYWEDSKATAQVLDDEGWLHTGDLAVIDANGPVRIVGRQGEVISRGGFKVYPGMIEMVLRSFPGVKETAVVGVPDMILGELTVACVVRRPGADLVAEELLAFASQHLADYALPDRILFFNALPRRGSGPVQREYLRERVRIRGRVWKYGKNIDTDAIIPARHCNTADPNELALHCMEDADPEFVSKMRPGDLIVADTNFGCGSSREVAPLAIKAAGVSAVVAKSFARIFFRNAINIGLPILECPSAVDGTDEGNEVEVEPANGIIRNLTQGTTFQATPFPDFLQHIIDRGGLLAYVEDRLANESRIGVG
jgi:fatty-acyl-CoA synthase